LDLKKCKLYGDYDDWENASAGGNEICDGLEVTPDRGLS